MIIPAGGDTKLKVSVFAGRSESVAVLVTTSVSSSVIVWLSATVSTGGLFTSVTMTLKAFVALILGTPSSITTVVIVFVLGPCASLGVQVITPLPSMLVPVGGFTN